MTQLSLLGFGDLEPAPKPGSAVQRLRVLITVKAAPNPSEKYGETVCVAGIRADLARPGWIRLYPINYRELASDDTFKKYDIIEIDAVPATQDPRRESWRPRMDSLIREDHLPPWRRRKEWLENYIEESMCQINRMARERADAKSLALVRPREVGRLKIVPHGGWTHEEQRKIDAYINQFELFGERDRTPLEAPRFRGSYRYRCWDLACRGHEQGILDWEFVALQRRFAYLSDVELCGMLEQRFLTMMCDSTRSTAFYVGNQAKRPHVFSVLGVYYPKA